MFNIPTQRLAKVTVTEPTSAVTLSVNPIVISALSFTPRHLVLRVNGKTQRTGNARDGFNVQFNGDTGTNYNYQALYGYDSTSYAARYSGAAGWQLDWITSDDTALVFGSSEALFPDALSTRTHKSMLAFLGAAEDGVVINAGRWASTAAITSITMKPYSAGVGFKPGSTFELCVVDETFNIDEQILGSDGTFTVSSIGAADGDLVCIGNARGARAGTAENLRLSFNGVTSGTPFPSQLLYGSSTTVAALALDTLPGYVGEGLSGNTATTGGFGAFVTQVSNYSDGSNHRVATTLCGYDSSGVSVSTMRWESAAAVSSLKFEGGNVANWLTGSMLSTYAVPKNLIERQELGGTATDVTFSSIPQTYDHLELTMYARSDRAVTMDNMFHNINGDTTAANYDEQGLKGVSSTVSAYQVAADLFIAKMPGASETANQFGAATVTFYNYTKTDRHKHYLNITGNVADNNKRLDIQSKRWENTAAITTIKVYPSEGDNFIAGSVFTLRGINAAPAAATDIETISGIAAANIEAVN